MYVTEDFYIKNENAKMKLKKNSGLPNLQNLGKEHPGAAARVGLGAQKRQLKQRLFWDPELLPLLYFLGSLLSAFWVVSSLIPLHSNELQIKPGSQQNF